MYSSGLPSLRPPLAAASTPLRPFSRHLRVARVSAGAGSGKCPLVSAAASSSPTSAPAPALSLPRVSAHSLEYESGYLGGVSEKTRWPAAATDGSRRPNPMEYVSNILNTKVYDVAIESPLEPAPILSKSLGVGIWLKREDLQEPVFSFKLRGAYNMMARLPREQLDRGVICSSSGNHAIAVAYAAQRLGCDALVVMPITTLGIKLRTVEELGATVVLEGTSYDEAEQYAKQCGEEQGRTFIPAFDHPDVISGQGTIGMEIVRQLKGPLHAIFVPVGGGGLIAGIATYVKRVRPEVKIIGVEPSDANAMALSLYHGERIMLEQVGGFADCVAVKVVGEETFGLCRELVDGVVLVNRDSICASIKDMFEENQTILEPDGALSLAGAEAYCKYYGLKGETVVAIISGANMNFDRLGLVSELADVGRKHEALLVTILPEKQGSFKQLCNLVGPLNITEVKYRYHSHGEDAHVLYSVGFHTEAELRAMLERMEHEQLKTFNLTNDDLAKEHLRYFAGGRSNIKDEVLFRFIFPEKPGALGKFLDAFSPRWNISLFIYRAQGNTYADVLVGIQIPKDDMEEFMNQAKNLGYGYVNETANEVCRLFLQ